MPPAIKSNKVHLMYRIDIGFSENRGYGAAILNVRNGMSKGIRANSPEQLMSRLRRELIEDMEKAKHFPLESEPSRIITPDGF
jgi:hypothetical protein